MLEHASTVDAMHLCYACLSGDVVALHKSLSSGSSVNGHNLIEQYLEQYLCVFSVSTSSYLPVLYSTFALRLVLPCFLAAPRLVSALPLFCERHVWCVHAGLSGAGCRIRL